MCITLRSQSGNAADCIIDGEGVRQWISFPPLTDEPPLIENISIENCSAVNGGAIYCDDASPIFSGCVISGNHATHDGGGIYCENGASPYFERCTISGNRAGQRGGGGFSGSGASPYLWKTILWDNCTDTGEGDEWYCDGGTLSYCCSDVDGSGIGGNCGMFMCLSTEPNIEDADPLFCDPEDCNNAPTAEGNYYLRLGSPCANAPYCGQIGALGAIDCGACCDISAPQGTGCRFVNDPSACEGPYDEFYAGETCTSIICNEVTGACCNDSSGVCQTDVNIADCLGDDRDGSTGGRVAPWSDSGGPTRFIPNGACDAFYPACGQGACCYGEGMCTYEDEATCTARPDFISFTYVGVCPGDIDLADPNQEPPAFEIPCPHPIPTVSEWGLIIMTLLLLTAGTVVFGRRRRAATA